MAQAEVEYRGRLLYHHRLAFASADLPKDGTGYDLAIAVGILAASGQLPTTDALDRVSLIGERALDGGIRPVAGVMALVAAAR